MSTVKQALQALEATMPSADRHSLDSAEVVVPGYVLGEVLGRGARSTVFRATRVGSGHAVALKIMPLRGGPYVCARVLRELDQRQPVDHPRILASTARGSLPDDTGIWLELELCRGSVLDLVSETDAPGGAEVWLKTSTGTTLLGTTLLHRQIPKGKGTGSLVVRKRGYEDFTEQVELTHDIDIKARLLAIPR